MLQVVRQKHHYQTSMLVGLIHGKLFVSVIHSFIHSHSCRVCHREGKYLAGIVAGSLAIKYNYSQIAYIGGFRIPQVAMNINAFARGVQSVAPNVVINVRITSYRSFFSPSLIMC
jgi:hypothetical protein